VKPIPPPDAVHSNEETHGQVLKTKLEEIDEHLEKGPTTEQLSKMFLVSTIAGMLVDRTIDLIRN
jgi:large subunit ribosomal protein L42